MHLTHQEGEPTMATLELTELHCVRKQDIDGFDEPQIKVNGAVVWNGAMKKGDTRNLRPTSVGFSGTATVKLEEMNGSKAKEIGTPQSIRDSGGNAQPVVFKTSGAHYELYFEVS
jgi:hypothetical protein